MNKIVAILCLIFITHFSYGQACGIYRLRYVGYICSDSLKVHKIKIPTVHFLHGLEDTRLLTANPFIKINPPENRIIINSTSPLTSHLYINPKDLLSFYKSKKDTIPVTIIATAGSNSKEIQLNLTWEHIQIKKIQDDGFGNLFELNFNEIKIE